jgi:site-specific recombinase XerD
MEKMAATPSAANNLLKRLRTLFDYSIVLGMRTDNPAKPVKAPRTTSKGFHEWTEEEIEQFQAGIRSGRRRAWRSRYSSAPHSAAPTPPPWASTRRSPAM